jgi:glycosyltransferase involved in cell wall biosynthesis
MKICFCSLLLPNEEKLMSKTKSKLPFSRHKFGMNVLKGLEANCPGDVTVMNIINTINFPKYKQLIFLTKSWSHNDKSTDYHIGYINLFGIKYLTQYHNLKRHLKAWVKANPNENLVIYVQDIFFPNVMAALSVGKKYSSVKTCLMTGDLNGKYGLAPDSNRLKNWLLKQKEKYLDARVSKFDSYVLVTKYMAQAMGVQDKPVTIMECLYEPETTELPPIHNRFTKKKIIFYAGSVREEYGILHLTRAFSLITDPDYRLWIAGGGAGAEAVKKATDSDPRITYLGFISPKEVLERQQLATILVNPRTSEHAFSKYSFAGKNMECLASGKPYVAHKLLCNPPEYDHYICYPDGETDEALAKKMIEVCEMSSSEKDEIAQRSRDFILQKKNPRSQCKKVVEMLRKISGEQ